MTETVVSEAERERPPAIRVGAPPPEARTASTLEFASAVPVKVRAVVTLVTLSVS